MMWVNNSPSAPIDVRKHMAGKHDQSSHGSWAGSKGWDRLDDVVSDVIPGQTARSLVSMLAEEGGFSFGFKGQSPERGFMVSRPGTELKMSRAELDTPEGKRKFKEYISTQVKDYLHTKTNYKPDWRDELEREPRYLGAWLDDEGFIYFDLSENVSSLRQAVQLGMRGKQLAVWDVENKETVWLDGREGRGADEMQAIRDRKPTTEPVKRVPRKPKPPSERFRRIETPVGQPPRMQGPTGIEWVWGKPKGVSQWMEYIRGERWFLDLATRARDRGQVMAWPTTLGNPNYETTFVTWSRGNRLRGQALRYDGLYGWLERPR